MNLLPGALAMAAWMLAALPAQAQSTQSMRCKNDLVNLGDGKASVLQKCGDPVARDSFCKPVELATPSAEPGKSVVVPCETVDEWTFNPGRGQFMTTLRFEAGRLAAITYGDRVR